MLEKFKEFKIQKSKRPAVKGGVQSGQPGASSFIQIRGRTSINGNTEPLFVIDGVIVDEDNFRKGELLQ